MKKAVTIPTPTVPVATIPVPVKTVEAPAKVKYVVVKNSPPPPVVKVEAPVPEVVVSGARILSPPPADVRLALLPLFLLVLLLIHNL